ncbi:MAG: FAD-dependent oxidoreductase, partial [Candidatus Eremiobacteraeota bacterium]|nr:FAD-dependent oxidoreductase [Candidatus Eremiobacteraeota bacterium]
DGVKCAFHHSGNFQDPELEHTVTESEVDSVRLALRSWLPSANGTLRGTAACMYALTPDDHFIIGPHADSDHVILAGGFSGHGFKFCPIVGEIVADLLTQGGTSWDIAMFSPQRFVASNAR